MIRNLILLIWIVLMAGCKGEIKNTDVKVIEEPGTEVVDADEPIEVEKPTEEFNQMEVECLGYWVGFFEPHLLEENDYSHQSNKINISLDSIKVNKLYGHSVVAGNDRPFLGEINLSTGIYVCSVKEPGDDKYDGAFEFWIDPRKGEMSGTWAAYKKIKTSNRKYELKRKEYNYDPSRLLDEYSQFIKHDKSKKELQTYELDGEMQEWMEEMWAMTTEKIYQMNASDKLLSKKDVENLAKSDLEIIRNTVYARHGYSFKNKIYRNFFDFQEWYIPVNANIKDELTSIEKKNIMLLKRYEKNAAEYYDSFGR